LFTDDDGNEDVDSDDDDGDDDGVGDDNDNDDDTWYKTRHAGTQFAQWNVQSKGRSR